MFIWINSIVQTLTTTDIISTKTNESSQYPRIDMRIDPLCSRCIEETLGNGEFTHIDDKRIRIIEGIEYFSELIATPNQQPKQTKQVDNNNNNNSTSGSKILCSSGEHSLTREEILFGSTFCNE